MEIDKENILLMKDDILQLKADVTNFKTEIIKWIVAIGIAEVALVVLLVKFL